MTSPSARPSPSQPVPDGRVKCPSPVPPYGGRAHHQSAGAPPSPSRTDEPSEVVPRYVGGPLDGQPAQQFRGRWSVWRDETGRHVPTTDGDRRYLGHHSHTYPPFYVCTDDDGVYRHSAWLASRRTTGCPTTDLPAKRSRVTAPSPIGSPNSSPAPTSAASGLPAPAAPHSSTSRSSASHRTSATSASLPPARCAAPAPRWSHAVPSATTHRAGSSVSGAANSSAAPNRAAPR